MATNRGLFFDRNCLKTIIVHNPSDWSYSAKSEPRYVISELAEKVAETHNAELKRE
jgi:primosomal protein N'